MMPLDPASSPPARTGGLVAGLFALCCGSLALEIAFTRILSVITFYYLAYFAISLAMLGMTAGALTVYLKGDSFDKRHLPRSIVVGSLAFSWSTLVSLMLVCLIPVLLPDGKLVVLPLAGLLFVSMACALPFYFSGIVTTAVLMKSRAPVATLYAADLIGAALACALVVAGLNRIDAPSVVIACGVLGSVAAILFQFAFRASWLRLASAATLFLLLGAATVNSRTHGIRPMIVKAQMEVPAPYTEMEKWNTLSRVTITRPIPGPAQFWGKSPTAPEPVVEQRWMSIDGLAGTVLRRFTSTADIDHLRNDVTNIAYYIAGGGRAGIIGVGGARDLQSAVLFGCSPVTGVDVNPIFIRLLTHDFAEFGGLAARKDIQTGGR